MKKKIKLAGVTLCLIAGIYGATHQENELPALLTENVEALASGEHIVGVNCYGEGSVDCYGYWAEMRIEGLR